MPAPSKSPAFFATAAAFRRWLEKNHATATELILGFHKKTSRLAAASSAGRRL